VVVGKLGGGVRERGGGEHTLPLLDSKHTTLTLVLDVLDRCLLQR
jgi:hypothetical protein